MCLDQFDFNFPESMGFQDVNPDGTVLTCSDPLTNSLTNLACVAVVEDSYWKMRATFDSTSSDIILQVTMTSPLYSSSIGQGEFRCSLYSDTTGNV